MSHIPKQNHFVAANADAVDTVDIVGVSGVEGRTAKDPVGFIVGPTTGCNRRQANVQIIIITYNMGKSFGGNSLSYCLLLPKRVHSNCSSGDLNLLHCVYE